MSSLRDSHEIYSSAVAAGADRLGKGAAATSISAFIAGLYATLGGMLALTVVGVIESSGAPGRLAWLAGSLFYPIGFIFVVLGRSELFTENFLYPVLAVWEGAVERPHRRIVRLWIFGFLFNIVGVLVMVGLLTVSDMLQSNRSLGDPVVAQFVALAEHSLTEPLWPLLWKAVFAGLLINFMSWLVMACEEELSRFLVIGVTTAPIMILGTHHSVVGSSEVLLGILHGADESLAGWVIRFLIPVAIGNHIGGVVFVAALHFLQSLLHRRDSESTSGETDADVEEARSLRSEEGGVPAEAVRARNAENEGADAFRG